MHTSMTRLHAASLAATLMLSIAPAGLRAEPAAAPQRRVLAHYMVCFVVDEAFSREEMRIAQAHGLDGFAVDFGAYLSADGTPTGYVGGLDRLFAAAESLGPDFQLLLTPEWSVRPDPTNIIHMVQRYYEHPNAWRHEGRFVLAPYGRNAGRDEEALQRLEDAGYDVMYMPFTGQRHSMSMSMEFTMMTVAHPRHEGLWRFTTDDSPRGSRLTNANMRRALQYLNKPFMAGVSPHYISSNLRDMRGLHGYGSVWEGNIHDGADWVQIITWNDYNEDTNLMHFKWKDLWDKEIYNRDGAYLSATAYWAQWFRSGRPPVIEQDRLFFAHRDRRRDQVRAWDPRREEWIDHSMRPQGAFTQIHDDVRDYVYVSTFLTEPASLTVELAGERTTFDAPAGVWHGELPMQPGLPRFTLERNGQELIDVVGRRAIIDEETIENSTMAHHQGNPTDFKVFSRLWAGSAVAGDALRLEAEAAELLGPAERVDIPGGQGVFLPTREDAAIRFAVDGPVDAMVNIRFLYSNPGPGEARLTLFAEGSPLEGRNAAIPVWLPTTGPNEFARATLLWTLAEGTTGLRLECHRKDPPEDEAARERWREPRSPVNDTADVVIDAIELVRVEPFTVLEREPIPVPELVFIPGGSFTMGSDDGPANERPAREVSVSSFAIGKYPVTNEEFEQFWPEHRQWRDGYSWRDREPVIYIDWRDAARYCNWLSEHKGLTPVYDAQDNWRIDREANGFRLPTEAEWEYVATGRGEDREYPWGDEAPIPMVHGNFEGQAALDVPTVLRSQEGQGTTVVGAFPRGASRDGLMDLAGNVVEWCSDWYQYYPESAEADPLQLEASHSRVLRGGSWGYYGYSQRARAREFNSPNYPGYIYVGFRVALPEAGWRALGDME